MSPRHPLRDGNRSRRPPARPHAASRGAAASRTIASRTLSAVAAVAALLACGGAVDGRPLTAGRTHDADAAATDRALAAAVARDDAVRDAQVALAQGRPFVATRLLQPALRDSARRTPAVELLAARASAAWQGWTELRRAIAGATWLDSLFAGEGHELLARAALGERDDSLAVVHARAAVERAASDSARGVRLVLLARALDRLERLDPSAAAYENAARLLPAAGDWLRLRAAGVEPDSARRAGHYAAITSELARARVALSEAQARRRTGDTLGAARAFAALGDTATALALRLAVGGDTARPAIRRQLVDLVRRRAGTAQASAAATLLDDAWHDLTPEERLLVARALVRSGPAARAVRAYDAAFATGAGTTEDRLAYADALFATRNYELAARMYAQVPASHPRRGEAMYDRARAQLRAGSTSAARATLRQLIAERPRDVGPASRALVLLADLATDEGRDAAARSAFRDVVRDYPTSPVAPTAGFYAALIAFVDGDARTAAREWDEVVQRWPQSSEVSRARYWAGRAWAAAGNRDSAEARWRTVVRTDPRSYYATRSRERLGAPRWSPPANGGDVPRLPEVDAAARRIALLEHLGMDLEARLEREALVEYAVASLERAVAAGNALLELSHPSPAIRIGLRALTLGGDSTLAVFRLLYPVVHGGVLEAEASRHGLDPALVAALIRQESNFEPSALSGAGARGLMQLMPATGQAVARRLGYPVWDAALLYQPDVNVELGTAHLASLVRQREDVAHVLAAYNAGGTPVARWLRKRGAHDPEVFTERISYAETRDYVRVVLRNREMYAALYGW